MPLTAAGPIGGGVEASVRHGRCRRPTSRATLARNSSPSTPFLPPPPVMTTMVAAMSDQDELGNMDPYGLRAMHYVRDHCPNRYATIQDPVSFFSSLGDQLRDEVLALEPTLGEPGPAEETWAEAVGRRNMARLMAEDQVFSELYQAMPPEEQLPEDQGWEPLMPDMTDIAQAEAEDL